MSEEGAFVLEGGVSAVAVAFLRQAVLRMIPYAVPSVFLIVLDLIYGVKAARSRNERVTLSTAMRRTVTKTFGYVCWLVLASTMALAFSQQWLEWAILGLVYANELASIIGNHLETKGLELNWKVINRALFRFGGQKAGLDTDGIDPNDFVKPIEKPGVESPKNPRPRDEKGRYIPTKK